MKLLVTLVLGMLITGIVEARMILPPLSDRIAAPMYIEQETQQPQAPSEHPKTVTEIVHKYADKYKIERRIALNIMYCESGGKPGSKNKRSSASGLYQFLNSTWKSSSKRYGREGASVFDADANAEVAMAKMATEGYSARSASKKCRN